MIATGKYFEDIVVMLNNFRSEVQSFSALGMPNINKHSENFLKRILNLTYRLELENLNKDKSNFPGIDIGDKSDGIAFQISSTKSTEKIDDTIAKCLKYKHYDTYKTIKVFILTNKQTSYTIKNSSEPYFSFSPKTNIMDFSDLFKDIENLDLIRIKALSDYLKAELQSTIDSIRNNEETEKKTLLDLTEGLKKSGLTNYSHWQTNVKLKTENISVPEMHRRLKAFLSNPALIITYLPILNEALRKSHSNKEMLYFDELQKTHAANYFYGNAMLIENSSITIEKANYTDGEILLNLLHEMVMLLTCVLYFRKQTASDFEIEISISLKSNTKVYFYPPKSLVIERLMSTFILDSPFEMSSTITNIGTDTLANLLQEIMHCFSSEGSTILMQDPFITIDHSNTNFVIDNIKRDLAIGI